ncbi:replication initiator protein [Sigmofec virus UA08Rod_5824]|uniref:Replication initiator protein n=1 Tax=Sigmofec virus UA08Rod_5824 TaxID=2929441 RepID=A0A976N139_9VIRU|nr:replication initiator protein [Sigmofec virus UA08Rod_5824]
MCLYPLRRYVSPSGAVSIVPDSGSPGYVRGVFLDGVEVLDYQIIPCGHCIECRLSQSREWANRMVCEAYYHKASWFLTLTYDNLSVPVSYYPDPDTGEALPALTLVKRDCQLFVKRLRKQLDYYGHSEHIRYYLAGEYGDKTHRPHYHMVVFGLDFGVLPAEYAPVKLRESRLGYGYYESSLIDKCWPYGIHILAPANWQTCAYVARYVCTKLGGDCKDFYTIHAIEPEFALMSRKPGLGREYYEQHKHDIYSHDTLVLSTPDGGMTAKPGRYYDALLEIEDPQLLEQVKERRLRYAEAAFAQRRRSTTLSPDEIRAAQARVFEARSKMLVRPDF